jgi:alpha-amylase
MPERAISRHRSARVSLSLLVVVGLLCPALARPVPEDPPPGWWHDATFYEIFVRSFADASSGPLAGDGIGDLQGLIEHLDYLNDGSPGAGKSLGVTALWLMPINPSPSYHGYDVTDYFGVNPQYGDLSLMKQLVREAHRRGIRVILDLVPNHASSQHPFFRQALADRHSPSREMFRFVDVPEQLYGPWDLPVWRPANGEFYYGIFSPEMPDWNFRAPAVTEHHRKVAAFWLQEVGVDGFRLDAVRYLYETGDQMQDTEETKTWLREFTTYCHTLKPGAFVIGECYADSGIVSSYLHAGATDSLFEFDLARATLAAVRLQVPGILGQQLERLHRYYGEAVPWANFLANHDQERTRTQLGDNAAQARLAAELQFTEPGVPFIYYGEEIGMRGAKPDPELRTPMQWTGLAPNAGFTPAATPPWHAVNADFAEVNVAREANDPDSFLSLYRRLIRINAASPALRHGEPLAVAVSGSPRLYAVWRQTGDEAVLVVANFGEAPVGQYELSLPSSRLQPDWPARELLQGAALVPPALNARGGFEHWRPVPELAAETLYVFRWQKP